MFKFILIAVFFIVSMVSIFGWLDISLDSVGEYQSIDQASNIKAKILVPEGMEAEYNATLNKLAANRKEAQIEQYNQAAVVTSNTHRSDPVDQASAFISGQPTANQTPQASVGQTVATQAPQTAQNQNSNVEVTRVVPKNTERIMIKVENYLVQNNHLVVDLMLYNNTGNEIYERLEVICKGVDHSLQPTDVFAWGGSVKIPAKKVVRLKGADFGYVNTQSLANIQCAIKS